MSRLELLTIRYLGLVGEALTLGCADGKPEEQAIRTAGKCHDRIEHIAQYILSGEDWETRALGLADDLKFIRASLERHAGELERGLPHSLPTPKQIDELSDALGAINSVEARFQQLEAKDLAGIINILEAHIQQLDGEIRTERSNLTRKLAGLVGDTIKRLRLHGVILLQLGGASEQMRREQREDAALDAAHSQVFILEQAPLSQDIKNAVRGAANNGLNRW